MKLEKIIGSLGAIISAGALVLASPNHAVAKVTQVDRRSNDTIIRIYDDEDPEGYLYPVRLCDDCNKYHPDKNRRIVGLAFQTKSGRIVDYPPQIDLNDSNLPVQPPIIQDNPPIIIQENPPIIFPIIPYDYHEHHHSHQGYGGGTQASPFVPNYNNTPYRMPPSQRQGSVTNPPSKPSQLYHGGGYHLNNSYVPSRNMNKPSQQQSRAPSQQSGKGFMPSNKYIPSKNMNKQK